MNSRVHECGDTSDENAKTILHFNKNVLVKIFQ